jgi:phage gp29-like protein
VKTILRTPGVALAQAGGLPPRRGVAPLPVALAAARPAALPVDLARIVRPSASHRWLLPGSNYLTPQYIETILRGALAGSQVQQWELFDLMEDTWPRLAKNLNEIKRSAIALDWKLEAWAEEETAPSATAQEKAKLVSSALWNMRPAADEDANGFPRTIYDLLDAWGKGVAVLELDWETRRAGRLGDIVAPRSSYWVHPSNYGWTEEGWIGLVLPTTGDGVFARRGQVQRFPENQFLVSVCKARSGHPLVGALLRPLAFWWCAANFTQEWFLNFAQIFGLPIRWANYDPNTPGLLDEVSDMLANMGSAAWGAFPAGTTLELKEAAKAGADNPQVALLDRADKQCDLLVLGQTLTTDVGASGSLALGAVHQSVRDDIVLAAAEFAAEVINQQLIPMILRLNFGDDDEAPEFCPAPRKLEDKKANAERDQILLGQGVEMPKAWFYERHDIPLPQPGEEIIAGRAPSSPFGGGFPSPGGEGQGEGGRPIQSPGEDGEDDGAQDSELAAVRASDATDKIVNAALEDLTGVQSRWLGGVKPFFAELVMLARSETVTDAQFIAALQKASRQLPEVFATLKPQALAAALNNAMAAAVVNGAVRGALKRRLPHA